VSSKHAVNSNPTNPPFPAGSQLALFGNSHSVAFVILCYCSLWYSHLCRRVADEFSYCSGQLDYVQFSMLCSYWQEPNCNPVLNSDFCV